MSTTQRVRITLTQRHCVTGSEYAQVAPGMGLYLTAGAAAVAFAMPLMHADDREQVPA